MYKQNAALTTVAEFRTTGAPPPVRLGKVLLHSPTLDELLTPAEGKLRHVVTVNSEIFVYTHEHPDMTQILENTVNTIDGRVVYLLCSLLHPGATLRKLSGSDFIYDLADSAARRREPLFVLGAEEHSNRNGIEALRRRCPGLMIEGYSPPFCADITDAAWNEAIHRRIESFRPAHIAVCFGPIKQEKWITQNADRLYRSGVRCAYGLGGTMDFVSGAKKRAPRVLQIMGVEWLFRLMCEPRRRLGRTAKMFKMFYFVFRFRDYEPRFLAEHESRA